MANKKLNITDKYRLLTRDLDWEFSYQDRKEVMERQLIPFFGKKPLLDITPEDIRAYRAQRRGMAGAPVRIPRTEDARIRAGDDVLPGGTRPPAQFRGGAGGSRPLRGK